MQHSHGLGIDAGGTFTDAVVLDFGIGEVVASCKASTTQPDPSGGIRDALAGIEAALLAQVSMVSLATTFATNAIVENRGAAAGLILVGYDEFPPDIPRETRVLMVKGGHTVSGEEKEPLDQTAIKKNLSNFMADIEAVAVAAFFSVRNPEHETRVADLIRHTYEMPVVRGHRLSMRLDAFKRATTAWWNARLIPLISGLIKATRGVLLETGIEAPFMVVRGDGTLMSAETALERPVDTLLSGPAASIMGARHLTGLPDALIVDMGGTTTDMAALSGGKVSIDLQGAHVGKWKTHVEAASVRTIGLGGDSLIALDQDRCLTVGPRRVVPLCVGTAQAPEMLEMLKKIQASTQQVPCGRVNPCSFYFTNEPANNANTVHRPAGLNAGVVSEYIRYRDTHHWFIGNEVGSHVDNGFVRHCALTPTDVRVAGGRFDLGLREAAQIGVEIFARHLGLNASEFSRRVEEAVSKKLCLEAIALLADKNGQALGQLVNQWFEPAPSDPSPIGVDVRVTLRAPVIGAGAPAAECIPQTCRRLDAQCILPDAYAVSVAVGAVVGLVDRTLTAIIRKTDTGRFVLHSESGMAEYNTIQEALKEGQQKLETLAGNALKRDHVMAPVFDFSVKEKRARTAGGEEIYLETQLHLRATGRPDVWRQPGILS
jgi:N-methylhydantoinase A/oxoprolinase/acetone carboxylase beta subunit